MFKFVIAFAFVALTSAQSHQSLGGHLDSVSHGSHSSPEDVHAEIKSLHTDVHAHGFQYDLETSNNIRVSAEGDVHGNMKGEFSYIGPKGEHIDVKYVADENGFQPISDVLPTSPPIPLANLKSLEYIRSHPPHIDDQLRKH